MDNFLVEDVAVAEEAYVGRDMPLAFSQLMG